MEVTSLHAELTGQREELETATARQSAVEEAVKANEKEKSSIARERGEAERKVWHPSPPLKLPRVLSHFLLVFLSSGFPPPFSHSHRLSATAPFVAGRPAAEADRWQRADLDSIARGNHPHREEKALEAKALKKAEEKRERAEEASAKLDTELSNIAETIDRLQSKHAGSQEDLAMGKEKRSEYKRLKTLAGANTAAFKERLQAARRELNTEEHLLVQLQNKANEV